jgi:N-acetylglucosamine-6-sulfatase
MDFTATILAAAGVRPPAGYTLDGQSILPLLGGPGTWRTVDAILIEHAGGDKVPPYCGIRKIHWLYARYGTGEEELYDLTGDPYQLANVAAKVPSMVSTLRAETQALCIPLPPGFSW